MHVEFPMNEATVNVSEILWCHILDINEQSLSVLSEIITRTLKFKNVSKLSLLCLRTLLIVSFTCLELSASLTTLLAWSMSDWKVSVSPMDRALTASWTCTTRRSTIWLKKNMSALSTLTDTLVINCTHVYFLYHNYNVYWPAVCSWWG